VVTASESLLVRALSNVLRNAVRYAGPSGPVTVSAQRSDASVEIGIADSGPGLPESELEQVFAPFYRPEASRTRATGGAGLGLAIVKTCVEACGGTVVARNRRPQGLEILMTLPAAKHGVAHASACSVGNPIDAVPPTASSNTLPPDSARSQP
jgi:two-component system sensor histidine kinase CpxA